MHDIEHITLWIGDHLTPNLINLIDHLIINTQNNNIKRWTLMSSEWSHTCITLKIDEKNIIQILKSGGGSSCLSLSILTNDVEIALISTSMKNDIRIPKLVKLYEEILLSFSRTIGTTVTGYIGAKTKSLFGQREF